MKNILMIATGGTIASKEGDLGLTPAVTGEALAVNDHKERVRLDCSIDNPFLNQYYESMGYEMAGTCKDGGMKAIGVKIYGITIEKNKS